MINELRSWLLSKLSTRRCRKGGECKDASFHTHHLTRFGVWRYIDRYRYRR